MPASSSPARAPDGGAERPHRARRHSGPRGGVARVALGLLGVSLIAVSAQLDVPVPGSDVPQSGQTLAVLLLAYLLPRWDGVLATLVYLGAGAIGLPVFAGGAAGWQHLVGPTSGYLAGFGLGAAWVAGFRAASPRFVEALLTMLTGHIVILACGGGRLALDLGLIEAYEVGVAPFVAGGLVKSLVAAAVVWGLAGMPGDRARRGPG